jgi:hypothetical protein
MGSLFGKTCRPKVEFENHQQNQPDTCREENALDHVGQEPTEYGAEYGSDNSQGDVERSRRLVASKSTNTFPRLSK